MPAFPCSDRYTPRVLHWAEAGAVLSLTRSAVNRSSLALVTSHRLQRPAYLSRLVNASSAKPPGGTSPGAGLVDTREAQSEGGSQTVHSSTLHPSR